MDRNFRRSHRDRFRERHVEVVNATPSVHMPLRGALDVARSIGYTIQYLEAVEATNGLACYVLENPIADFVFETTFECDFTPEDVYATIVDEEDRESARSSPVGASNQTRVYALIRGSEGAFDRTCLQEIDVTSHAFGYLMGIGWRATTLAVVDYISRHKQRFQHKIDFLVPPPASSVRIQYPADFRRDIASGAEWILPKKRELPDSQNFVRHTRRIAIGLARDLLRGYAGQELSSLERRETEGMTLRLFEAYLTIPELIESKQKSIDHMMQRLDQYKRKLIEKAYDPYARVTERGEASVTLRDKVEKADADAHAFKQQKEREIAQLRSQVADAAKGKRLRETTTLAWVFRVFMSVKEPNAMHTPSVRTVLCDSEAHPNLAAVNETLMRLGKQSNVQLFCESVIPFVPLA